MSPILFTSQGRPNVLKILMPYPPSINRLWRASKRGGVYKSQEYRDWQTEARWEIDKQIKKQRVSGHYKLTILVVRPDKRRRDLGNLEKAISDILVMTNTIDDDCLCDWIDIRWTESGPDCMVIIEPMGEIK